MTGVTDVTDVRKQDVVGLLLEQHRQIRALFGEVATAQGTRKRELFEDLVRPLAVHESAEEQVVHPAARRGIDGGDEVATHEEQEEFQYLRRNVPADKLRKMAGALKAAEAIAPTRPHPNAGESAAANMLAGPPIAVFDRMRDAVRDWRRSNDDN